MADREEHLNGDDNEALRRNENPKRPSGRQFPGVDFEELNFEQRRAPYNSGSRFISDKMHDPPNGEG